MCLSHMKQISADLESCFTGKLPGKLSPYELALRCAYLHSHCKFCTKFDSIELKNVDFIWLQHITYQNLSGAMIRPVDFGGRGALPPPQ